MIELLIGLLLLFSGRDDQRNGQNRALIMDPKEMIVNANNDFSFKISNILSKDENDVMSSLSILSALSILMNGAKGETLRDLQKFLKFEKSNQIFDKQTINKGFELILKNYQDSILNELNVSEDLSRYDRDEGFIHILNIANKVIGNRDIKLTTDFENTVKQYFGADVQIADFINNSEEETNKVNEWVRNKTNNKIESLFKSIERDTIILIINVLYFKGSWKVKFNDRNTQKLEFYNNGITPIKTAMLTYIKPIKYVDSDELNSQILEMDYFGNQFSFFIVLPKERNGLKSLKEKINSENFNRVIKSMNKRNVEVFIPKFKIEKKYELMKEINPKPIALTDRADLTGLATDPLQVSQILHKVFIEVNENGTEAAAVTAIQILRTIVTFDREILFRADHPFLFFIRDKTNGMILFSGQINKL